MIYIKTNLIMKLIFFFNKSTYIKITKNIIAHWHILPFENVFFSLCGSE